MVRTVIYRKWRDTSPGDYVFMDHVASATEGVHGVDNLYMRGDGFMEIRMTDPEAYEYWIPIGQILAYFEEAPEHVGED